MTQEIRAEIRLPTQELRDDLPFYTKTLGFRLDMIFPADNPSVAVLSGHGVRLRIEKGASEPPGTLRILTDDPGFAGGAKALVPPNGTKVEVDQLNPPVVTPTTEHAFVVRRLADQAPWVIGRAGMEYRDLVPTRLGGAMIASHIRVPDGPVPDMVHYHKVGFQLIFCVAGWVDVLYEDQGDIRRIHAGDCFIQPPTIRHKVLHSEGVQVVVAPAGLAIDTRMAFHMVVRNGGWLVDDVSIDGTSIVASYRTQFTRILREGSFSDLMEYLKMKAPVA